MILETSKASLATTREHLLLPLKTLELEGFHCIALPNSQIFGGFLVYEWNFTLNLSKLLPGLRVSLSRR